VGALRLELVQVARVPDAPAGARRATPVRVRVVDSTLRCIARQGIAKTTLDDVAREAGCSRATVYRAFPGGKDGLLAAVADTEVSRLFSALAVAMGAAHDIEEVLVAGMVEAAATISAHPALAYLLDAEAEVVLPYLAFSQMDGVLDVASTFTAPFLGRWLDHDEAKRVAEWATRLVVSYLLCPAEGVDLCDEAHVRHLVRTFVLPGIRTPGTAAAGEPALTALPASRGAALGAPGTPTNTQAAPTSKGEAS